jgi:hypothetical protein
VTSSVVERTITMKLIGTMLLLAALALGVIAPATVTAKDNPSQICADNTITVGGGDESFPLEIPSHGGCVSTVAVNGNPVAPGDYSHAAFVAQCKLLESELPSELWNAPVVIDDSGEIPSNIGGFGGKIETCTWLLEGYHSGTLTHPE